MKLCEDCGIDIHPEAFHTGHERWCENCFELGLMRDMDDHWNNFWKNEMEADDETKPTD